ncbi:hypothetical protein M408DRAFT_315238 [Serendipita vermifera MAFF 305830]|uniref:ATPase AAA-type core domain-containing protein n=1 Tax=Serendipita vermifera MAFF 305830 TaxID=933852 RepID=A0A0C2WGU6_SERVB|nr:hypothetical protein M408DRAFT_315238 [Serendipita vermifera MAFF 305830]
MMHCGISSLDIPEWPHLFPKRSEDLFMQEMEDHQWTLPQGRQSSCMIVERPEPMVMISQAEALESIPEDHRAHAAISRLISQHNPFVSSQRIWNDKYAPKRAEEVLHNTPRALYLQQWLKFLEIQMDDTEVVQENRGIKRPRPKVQRDVGKRRKRQKLSSDPFGGLDDFIVDDEWNSEEEEEEEEGFLSTGEDLPRASTVTSPTSSRAVSPLPPPLIIIPRGTKSRPSARQIIESSPPSSPSPLPPDVPTVAKSDVKGPGDDLLSLTERLTNTILLTGPCGSGKTAAVYACAEELKWKVFEFYPGIGKRSGAGFTAEVGGTGDNHRVGGKDKEAGSSKTLQTIGFLTSPSKKRAVSQPLSETDIQDVRQSLILVEEADILYQSDGNLWPTLINFIRKSRRPVILTCNDVDLIPVSDIPLQTILEFKPCEVELATSYLQAISLAEGYPIARNVARDIYTDRAVYFPMEVDVPDQPMLPVPSQGPIVQFDLKRAINHTQFSLITAPVHAETSESSLAELGSWSQSPAVMPEAIVEGSQHNRSSLEDLETILQLGDLSECISFADAHVDRRPKVSLELGSVDRYGPSSDDMIGHTQLSKSQEPEEAFGVALCPRDCDMAVHVAYHARLQLEQRGYGEIARRELVPCPVTRLMNPHSNRDARLGMRWKLDMMELALARSEYQGRIVKALDEKIVLSSVLLPRPGCVLDYIPYMQETVRGMQGDHEWMSTEGSRVLITEGFVSPVDAEIGGVASLDRLTGF